MAELSIDQAISDQDIQQLIEYLEDKELPIEDVKRIYFACKENKEVVGQAAMNLSLRTSVYERDKEYSDTMVELLIDISKNPVDMGLVQLLPDLHDRLRNELCKMGETLLIVSIV